MAEVEASKRRARSGRGGGVNIIVMNAVLEACVSCGDVDLAVQLFDEMRGPMGCGVDGVSYGILLKGLGIARRIDEAFEILESVEKDTSDGSPRLSPHLLCGFLNALIEAVSELDTLQGYIKSNFPLGALTVKDEILRQGLKPDRLTYNTIIFACVKSAEIEKAFQFLEDMKDEAKRDDNPELLPDAVTYTTLLKGLGNSQDLYSVLKIVVEMKSSLVSIDRTAYTAMADAFLACGSIDGALCIFGEIIKQAGDNKDLRPKPHLYLSIMRAFATIGDFDMVRRLKERMWPDSVGSISRSAKQEADELLMEAAINNNQVDVARRLLRRIVNGKEHFSWRSRVGLILLNDPVEKYMIPFRESRPLGADLILENVAMRFLKDSAVPLVNDWGSCVGIVHSRDCTKLPTVKC
uniref:Pentatricopeptide repeat-containing protein n=1 Tax=Aegilops tauschii TaxID=37682 RepID=N1R302_AEGTA